MRKHSTKSRDPNDWATIPIFIACICIVLLLIVLLIAGFLHPDLNFTSRPV